MNAISFSLYGNDPLYLIGALRNAEIIDRTMTHWRSVFYVDTGIPSEIIKELQSNNASVLIRQKDWHENGMFWRFNAFTNSSFDYICIRDVDSRISERDMFVIDEWLSSNKEAHIIRDHPQHSTPIMGGLWGARQKLLSKNDIWAETRKFGIEKGEDQRFLSQHVYPVIRDVSLIHDSFFEYEKNSTLIARDRIEGEYLGEVIDEREGFDPDSRKSLVEIESSLLRSNILRLLSKIQKSKFHVLVTWLIPNCIKRVLNNFVKSVP